MKSVTQLKPGERLEMVLKELRLTQTALGEMCGRDTRYVNAVVRCNRSLVEDFAIDIAREVSVDLHWLYTGEGTMFQLLDGEVPSGAEVEAMNLEDLLLTLAEKLHIAAGKLSFSGSDQWKRAPQG